MVQAIANRYAQALADSVMAPTSDTRPEVALEQLRQFEKAVQTSPDLRRILESPAVSVAKKRAAIERLGSAMSMSRLVRNFLYILVDRRRSDLLDEVAGAFEAAIDERLGVVRANVTSATPLDGQQREQLRTSLAQVAGKDVRCVFEVDPELIGGVVARIGSTVYDGSVRSQLDAMRHQLTATL